MLLERSCHKEKKSMRILVNIILIVLLLFIGLIAKTMLELSGYPFLATICLVALVSAIGGVISFKKKKKHDSPFSIETSPSTTKRNS